jgi:hypothetical protein
LHPFFGVNQQRMSQPQLFYSNRCSHSRQILQTLQVMNKSELVNAINIDTVPRHQLPPFLKSVPTLYAPDTKETYIGKDIYAYIAKPVTARRELPTGAGGAKVSTQGAPQSADPGAWGFGSGGLTESYSMWDTPTQFSHTDQLNYTYLSSAPEGMASAGGDTTPQNIQQRGEAKSDMQVKMEQMQKMRDKEFTAVSRK